MIVSVGSTGFIIELMKTFFMRARPENALQILNDYSFPSGHAALAAAFFIVIAYLFTPKIHSWVKRELFIVICVLVIILIGVSRIVLNVHWVSDVIAGWSLGIFCATATILLVRYVGALVTRKRLKEI
ncbi:MAG: phosphatase PAP2 family protein, partial [Patescibacteria group bacterium]